MRDVIRDAEVQVQERPLRVDICWGIVAALLLASASATAGTDVLVNNPASDAANRGWTQSETAVAAFGNTVCVAWNDSGEASGIAGFGNSSDGGATFTDRGAIPRISSISALADPSLAYSLRDNAFYYSALSSNPPNSLNALALWRSSNGCESFGLVGRISGSDGGDKEMIAVDNNSMSSHYGRLYIGWKTSFSSNQIRYSDDGGVNWLAPLTPPSELDGNAAQGMWPAVAPNGDVYFAVLNWTFQTIHGLENQWIFRSTDGGQSWQKMTDIAAGLRRPEDEAASLNCHASGSRPALNGGIFERAFPQIAIHPDPSAAVGYVINAVYHYDSDGTGPDNSNVFYRRSTDGAVTWSAPIKVNSDATPTDQWSPTLAVDSEGVVAISWYDRRLDPNNNLAFDRFAAISADGGLTWSANQRVSDVSSPVAQTNPTQDPLFDNCYHGDYDQVAISGDFVRVVWSDDRRITTHGPDPDVYYDQISLDQDADGIRANDDNCPFFANPLQQDDGGVNTTTPDGIGNACQCGDVSGNGIVEQIDADAIRMHGLGIQPNPNFVVPGNCDVSGNNACNGQDANAVQRAVNGLTPNPLFGQRCHNAIGLPVPPGL